MARRSSSTSPTVLIIGGGIMGTSCAWSLARRGAQVTVLEKSIPGAEASSAAAGILGAQLENTAPGALFDLCRASMKLYPTWARRLREEAGLDIAFRSAGSLRVAYESKELTSTYRNYRWQSPTLSVRRLDRKGLTQVEPHLSSELAGGVFLEDDAHLTPTLLYRATHIAASRAGVTFRTGAFVKRLLIEDERATGVLLDDGTELRADFVVVAAGSWSSLIEGLALGDNRIVPARGQIVELESPEPVISRVVCGPHCYLIPRDDGRTLIGSTLEFVGYRKEVTARGMRDLLDAALKLVPRLADAVVRNSWSNFRPYTGDHLPLLGRGHLRGLVIASGHYRNGILLAPITAETVTRIILGGRALIDLRTVDPLRSQ